MTQDDTPAWTRLRARFADQDALWATIATLRAEHDALATRVQQLEAALKEAHELLQDFHAVTEIERFPELCARADAMLLPCDEADYCPTLPAAFAPLGDAMHWQPIETAPKDGTKVDVWAKVRLAAYDKFQWGRFTDCYWTNGDSMTGRNPHWVNLDSSYHAVYWMPLPSPPAVAALGEEQP
jgi:hypothetical protein